MRSTTAEATITVVLLALDADTAIVPLTNQTGVAIVSKFARDEPALCMDQSSRRPPRREYGVLLCLLVFAASLSGCASERPVAAPATISPIEARELIDRSLPHSLSDRAGWAADMYAGFTVLGVEPTHENICAVVAVIEQESGFRVDPIVPNLSAVAWREIDERAAHAGVPRMILHGVLQLPSSTGRSYSDRIDNAKTEKELSDIFEDFIGAVPMGRTLFADHNPIRTRGPMQVHIVFAQQYAAVRPYPYPVKVSIADEVFTRRGGLYFGIAHLLAYPAAYDRYLYRFADFNAGQYASRNAAFQRAVSSASGIPLVADGAPLPHDADANAPGATELAARALAARLNISDGAIHRALEQVKTKEFEQTPLYQRMFALAEQSERRTLPRASVPRIELHGPKITRKLTTEWYANRVNERFERCLIK
jgi:Protein of unknown function (DUF1615)